MVVVHRFTEFLISVPLGQRYFLLLEDELSRPGEDPIEHALTPTGTFPISGKFATATMEAPGELIHSDVPWTQNFSGPHALHGLVTERPWRVTGDGELSIELGEPWPWPCRVVQRTELSAGRAMFWIELHARDPMPAAVGSGAEWTAMVAWFAQGKSIDAVAKQIDAAWPS